MAFWSLFQSAGPTGGRPISLARRVTLYATGLLGAMALVTIGVVLEKGLPLLRDELARDAAAPQQIKEPE